MKKKIFSILLIGILLIGVCGCKKKDETNNNSSSKVETVTSIRDNSIYFVSISGKKFKAGDKLSSISKVKLSLKEKDLSQTIPKNRYLMAKSVLNSKGVEVCSFVALNDTDSTIDYKDAVIGGFEVGDINYGRLSSDTLALNIEIVGGIKLGSSYEDLVKVFGEEDFKYESEANEKLKHISIHLVIKDSNLLLMTAVKYLKYIGIIITIMKIKNNKKLDNSSFFVQKLCYNYKNVKHS